MFRKRRRPTPNLGIPPPFMPMTGEHATLQSAGIFPYCAMVQVAAADTYDDYVICRGFDPRIRRFIDYPPGLNVAKPFGKRVTGTYQIGQVFPALLPTQGTPDYTPPSPTAVDWRVGQNPGVTDNPDEGGHPKALTDAIEELVDHNGDYINWMLLDATGQKLRGGCLAENHKGRGEVFEIYLGEWDCSSHKWVYDTETAVKAIDWRYDVPYPDEGATGLFQPMCSSTHGIIWETVALDCDTPGECGD
jgi:hypothetical protein